MRRFSVISRAISCLLAFLFCAIAGAHANAATRPNVVLIQVDDMSKLQLRATYQNRGRELPAMPKVMKQIAAKGVEFSQYRVSDPICGPSRASLLTGQATHNHGMRIHASPYGYPYWQESQGSRENLPVWLDRAGYRTIHVGKYMNGYGANPPNEIPAGWDRFVSPTNGTWSYYGNALNVNGVVTTPIGSWAERDQPDCLVATITTPGYCTHATDLQTAYAVDEISSAAAADEPFYLQLDYNAPHADARRTSGPEPPERLQYVKNRTTPPRKLANRPVSQGQPLFIREQAPLNSTMKKEIRTRWGNEVASLKGVDQGIGRVISQLRTSGLLANTYVIFTSDTGLFHGEHRIKNGKFLPHEPSTRQPLIMRGPDLPADRVTTALSSNLSLASTVLSMTGAGASSDLDAGSLIGFARHPRRASQAPVLLEGFNGRDISSPDQFFDGTSLLDPNQALVMNYTGLIRENWKYVSYAYGEEELYNL
ncbi:MAG: sulfatase-like hydrolase/transferase, partial [Solirubrobacterales bacterium]